MEQLKSIKGYEVLERVGAGGFGAVYRARQTTINREVAIKFIVPGYASQPDFIRRFEVEAQLIAHLEHPHITPLIDYWRDGDGAYLVMRYLRGGSVRDLLNKGSFDLDSTSRLLDQIASALAFAHRNDVIHRDIKPGNILLDEDGNAYLADFGIAKDLKVLQSNTQPDAVVGSLDYISPEQARNEPITPRTDIYSLGVMLYEMITGEHPFKDASSVERLFKHISEPLPLIATLPDNVKDTINAIIQCATAKDPMNRYEDVLALAIAFREGIKRDTPTQQLSALEQMTLREHEILQLIADGLSNNQIAEQLFITLGTVKWHVNQLYKKLGVRSRVQAIIRAREMNLIVTGDDLKFIRTESPSQLVLPEPENPYKGLRAFQTTDSRDFFGREELVEKLLHKMSDKGRFHRLIAVVGPSGSGKSSLVKAGLIPALWRGGLPDSEKWFVVDMVPGTHPLDELEIALTRVAANQVSSLNEQLQRDERGLVRAAELILPKDATELVVIVDQFEEVFTLVEDEAKRQHFLNLLTTAVTDKRSRVRVVLTLRADYYDKPLHYLEFGEMLKAQMETVLPLSARGLERAIAAPAERVDLSFEPGLVAQIVSEMTYQAGALPLLQYALTELFERRHGRLLTHAAYKEIGGAVGALANRADEIFLSFSEKAQELSRQIFLRLVTPGEGAEDTRRRVERRELLSLTDDTDLMDEILDTFAEHRLFSFDHDAGTRQPTVELAHEAIIREWERLREWLNNNREDIKLQRQLSALASEWQHANRDSSFLMRGSRLEQFEKWSAETSLSRTANERAYLEESLAERTREKITAQEQKERETRLERRSLYFLRGLVAVFALAAVIATGLSIFAFNERNRAESALVNEQIALATSAANVAIARANFALSESQRLAAESNLLISSEKSSELAALLAVRALNSTYSPQADMALQRASRHDYGTALFNGGVNSGGIDFSPDGRYLLAVDAANVLSIWNIQTKQLIRSFSEYPSDSNLPTGVFLPDNRHILYTPNTPDHAVLEVDFSTGEITRHFIGHTDDVINITLSPDGQYFLTGSRDNTVRLWNIETGTQLHQFDGGRGGAFSPDGSKIVTFGSNLMTVMWDTNTGERLIEFTGHTDRVNSAVFTMDGLHILTASIDRTVRQWETQTGMEMRQFSGHADLLYRVAVSPDGQFAASSSLDTTVRLWDLTSGQEIRRFNGHIGAVYSIAFSPDSRYLASSGRDGVRVWDLQTATERDIYAGLPGVFYGLSYSHDGQYLAAGSNNTLYLRGADHLKTQWMGQGADAIISLDISPDNRSVLVSYRNNRVGIWDVFTRKMIHELTDALVAVYAPDGTTFITGGSRGVFLWDSATANQIRQISEYPTGLSLAFAPDGQSVLLPSGYETYLVDLKTGGVLQTFSGYQGSINAMQFSPDGQYLLTAGSDNLIRLWDVSNGIEIRQFVGHSNQVWRASFSADMRQILSASQDGTGRLWDTATGRELRRYVGEGGIQSAVFSPDGRWVLLGSTNGKLYRTPTFVEELITGVCQRILRDLNRLEQEQYSIYEDTPSCPIKL